MSDRRAAAIAARQHGLLTREQARAAGLSDAQIHRRLASGRWIALHRGVYLIAGTPPSAEQVVLAAVLAARRDAVASHLTAAELWGLRFPPPDAVHVLTGPGAALRLEGVRHHRSELLDPGDRTVTRGVPVTAPARTIADCAAAVSRGVLEEVIDDAERRRLVRITDLTDCVDRAFTGPGRRPTLDIRAVLSERLPVGDSGGEKQLVRELVRRGCPVPVLGHRVEAKGRRYKIDVAWPWAMTGLELDGWAFHSTFLAFHRDRRRLRHIQAEGWTIWQVTTRTDLDELVADLLPRLSVAATA
jgi:hypothetical protein